MIFESHRQKNRTENKADPHNQLMADTVMKSVFLYGVSVIFHYPFTAPCVKPSIMNLDAKI